MTEPTESQLERVRRLLALAENAGSEHEAELAQGKAMEAMAKYGIDQAMLAAAGKVKDEVILRRITIRNPYSDSKASMLGWLAMAMRCEAVLIRDPGGRSTGAVDVVGYESDIDRVEILFTSLLLQATGQVIHVTPPYWENVSTARFRKNWFYAFAIAATKRVKALEERAAANTETVVVDEEETSTALVLVDRKAQVDRTFHSYFPNLGKRKQVKLGAGAAEGMRAGQKADLGNDGGLSAPAKRRQIS